MQEALINSTKIRNNVKEHKGQKLKKVRDLNIYVDRQ